MRLRPCFLDATIMYRIIPQKHCWTPQAEQCSIDCALSLLRAELEIEDVLLVGGGLRPLGPLGHDVPDNADRAVSEQLLQLDLAHPGDVDRRPPARVVGMVKCETWAKRLLESGTDQCVHDEWRGRTLIGAAPELNITASEPGSGHMKKASKAGHKTR